MYILQNGGRVLKQSALPQVLRSTSCRSLSSSRLSMTVKHTSSPGKSYAANDKGEVKTDKDERKASSDPNKRGGKQTAVKEEDPEKAERDKTDSGKVATDDKYKSAADT